MKKKMFVISDELAIFLKEESGYSKESESAIIRKALQEYKNIVWAWKRGTMSREEYVKATDIVSGLLKNAMDIYSLSFSGGSPTWKCNSKEVYEQIKKIRKEG
jgi:hypothetical protein